MSKQYLTKGKTSFWIGKALGDYTKDELIDIIHEVIYLADDQIKSLTPVKSRPLPKLKKNRI